MPELLPVMTATTLLTAKRLAASRFDILGSLQVVKVVVFVVDSFGIREKFSFGSRIILYR